MTRQTQTKRNFYLSKFCICTPMEEGNTLLPHTLLILVFLWFGGWIDQPVDQEKFSADYNETTLTYVDLNFSCFLTTTMAKSTVTNAPRNVQNSDKNSGYTCTTVFVALLAIGGAYLYLDRTTTLNRFSEVFCDTLSAQAQQRNVEKAETKTSTPEPVAPKLTRGSSNDPKLAGGKSYNAKGSQTCFIRDIRDSQILISSYFRCFGR